MIRFVFRMAIVSALALVGTAWAGKDASRLRLELDLVDGSHLIGIPRIESVLVQTSYSKMNVALKQILTIKIAEDHENASIELRNGDKLKGVINLEPIKLDTVFGTVKVGIEHVRDLRVVLSGGSLPDALRNGLVLYYSFDRDENGKVTDWSGRKNDGEVKGAKWTAKGVKGGAFQFDGNDDHIDSMNTSLANGSGEVTISVWACPFANSPNAGIATACFPNGMASLMISEGYTGKRTATFYVGNGVRYDGASVVPYGVFTPETWRHLVGTWKSPKNGGDGLLRVYFDGVLSTTSKLLDGAIAQSTSLKIGWDDVPNQPEKRRFNGLIDEVMIFNRALSTDEVKQIYDAQK